MFIPEYISLLKFKRRKIINQTVKALLDYTQNLNFADSYKSVNDIIQKSNNNNEVKIEILEQYCKRKRRSNNASI